MKVLQKSFFHGNRFEGIPGSVFVFVGGLGVCFWGFRALKTDLEIDGFLVLARILSSGTGGGDQRPIWTLKFKEIKASPDS